MTPLLAVMKRLPDWRVAVVVEEPYDQILRGNPYVDQLFVINRHPASWLARLKVIRQIRDYHSSIAIDLHGGTTSAFLTALSGAPRRVGYGSSRNAYCYNVRVPDSRHVWGQQHVHTVEHQLSALKHLGFPVEPIPAPTVPVGEDDLEFVRGLIRPQSITEGFVLIHPAAAFDTKQWDAEKFALLSTQLVNQGHQVVMTAGRNQGSLLQEIRQHCSPHVGFVQPQSLPRFSALTSLCGLYVGNDTGTTHIAAALGKKVVVIFGSSDFKVWYPWNVEHRLIRSDMPCMPCPGYVCLEYGEPRCIRSIELQTVLEAVQEML